MDILKPDLIWIDKKCYRINSSDTYETGNIEFNDPHTTNFHQSKNFEDLGQYQF